MPSRLTWRNRENAMHSTGPKTPEGKARASQNSLIHGLYAKSARLPSEDEQEYFQHQKDITADLKPDGALQRELALQITDNFWRLRRFRLLEELHRDRQIKLFTEPNPESGPESGFVPTESGFVPSPPARSDDPRGSAPHFSHLESVGRQIRRVELSNGNVLKQLQEMQKEILVTSTDADSTKKAIREELIQEQQKELRILQYTSSNPWSLWWHIEGMPPPRNPKKSDNPYRNDPDNEEDQEEGDPEGEDSPE